jgi:SAM-dependent methyltransferase
MSDRQPTRSKRVREDRRFDRTQLRISGHGRTVHRDYWAHVLRWPFVVNQLNYTEELALKYGWVHREIKQGMSILDIGCGQDQPLLYVLGARIQTVPEVYVGVDLNPIRNKSRVKWADIHDQFDFVNNWKRLDDLYTPFDVCVCFEVIEHMSPEDGAKMLVGIRSLLKPGGLLYLSTPVFNGLAAANHIHEYRADELNNAIVAAGFDVKQRYGTFASKPDIKPKLSTAEVDVYNRLEKWFGGEILSCIFAPLYPDASRNILWVCQKPAADESGEGNQLPDAAGAVAD